MDNLQILKNQYQAEIDKLKQQIAIIEDPCSLLKDSLKSYVSGWLALNKLDRLNNIDTTRSNYSSIVLYNKERDRIIKSKLI